MSRAVLALLIASAMSTSLMERAEAQPPAAAASEPGPTDEGDLLSANRMWFSPRKT